MDATTFRTILFKLGVSQAQFAEFINVTPRALTFWLSGDHDVPGAVAAYLSLVMSLPPAMLAREAARMRKENTTMFDGMYGFAYQGVSGVGSGTIVLDRGRIFGHDGGVQYDGAYAPSSQGPGHLDINLRLTVPPGIALVQGVPPQPHQYSFDLTCTIRAQGASDVQIATPYGPVGAHVRFLRPLPQ